MQAEEASVEDDPVGVVRLAAREKPVTAPRGFPDIATQRGTLGAEALEGEGAEAARAHLQLARSFRFQVEKIIQRSSTQKGAI